MVGGEENDATKNYFSLANFNCDILWSLFIEYNFVCNNLKNNRMLGKKVFIGFTFDEVAEFIHFALTR